MSKLLDEHRDMLNRALAEGCSPTMIKKLEAHIEQHDGTHTEKLLSGHDMIDDFVKELRG